MPTILAMVAVAALANSFAALTVRAPLPAVGDVACFYETSKRVGNDAANKRREAILPAVPALPAEYLNDATHGGQWRALRDACAAACGVAADDLGGVRFAARGGRHHHHDLDATLPDGTVLPIEFKNGTTTLKGLPQFLSLPIKGACDPWLGIGDDDGTGLTYTSYFYKHYASAMPGAPDEAEYMRHVNKHKTDHPFFAALKAAPPSKALVDASIHAYLGRFRDGEATFDPRAFLDILSYQGTKRYLLWKKGKYGVATIDVPARDAPIEVAYAMGTKKVLNTVVFRWPVGDDAHAEFRALLRWRNGAGVLNPAWQIRYALDSRKS